MTYSEMLMIFVFIIGYVLITFENYTRINKATIALMMAVICWVLQFFDARTPQEENLAFFGHHLSNISQVVFFLLGALTIVEIINVHNGFKIISNLISFRSKRVFLWVIGILTFFLSAVLDNLTTTVVIVSLLGKLLESSEDRLLIGGGVVIAANAGGAWTPIGDVTTTMLWIGGQVSTLNIMQVLFLPSLGCLVGALIMLSFMMSGHFEPRSIHKNGSATDPMGNFVFFLGLGALMFVPFFRVLTGLPPFMGMLFGLSGMWLITDLMHRKYDDKDHLRVPSVLSRIDLSGTLFFLGILLCIDALETAKILDRLAHFLDTTIGNTNIIAIAIGLASAVIDNVPLVAATMGMYGLQQYPTDHTLWNLIAFCAGTGGSILLIGSAAGIVFMGLEKVDFIWYLKRISLAAVVGYFAGVGIYLLTCSGC